MSKDKKDMTKWLTKWENREARIAKKLSVKCFSVILTVVYFLSLVPMLVIAQYNYAGADDYSIGETCHTAWLTTHNVFAVIWQAVLMAYEDFLHWMGYFSAIFMMSIHPGVFGEHVYAATTWLMLFMLTFGTMYLMKGLLHKALHMDLNLVRCVTMILLLITVQCAVGRNEAFYWYCGAVNYTFFYGVGLFFFGAVIRALCEENTKKRRGHLILACFLGVFVGGGNYMTALTVAIVLFAMAVVMWVSGHKASLRVLAFPAISFLIGFGASCLAPGNSYRSSITEGMGAVKAVLISLYYFWDYCVSDYTTWPVILGFFLAIPFIVKMVRNIDFTFPCPLLVFLMGYGLASANITPPLYAIGNIGAGRLQALFFIQYLLCMMLCLIYGIGFVVKRYDQRKQEDSSVAFFSGRTIRCIGALSLMILFASALSLRSDPYFYTSSSAVTDLCNGQAKAYGDAMAARTKVLKDDSVKDVVFERVPSEPELLFFSDLTDSMDSWENKAVARYYGKDSVIVVKE